LKNLQEQGITILVSTPYMDEASLCDRIALVQRGSFLSIDSPAGIVAGFKKRLFAVHSLAMSQLLTDLRGMSSVESCYAFGDSHHITLKKEAYALTPSALQVQLEQRGHQQVMVREIQPGIEDCFMELSDH